MRRLEWWIEAVRLWAHGHQDVVSVLVVGSHARGVPTSGSDIDFVVLVRDVQPYLLDHEWASAFGQVEREEIEDWGRVRSLRVWYQGGTEVEWGLTTMQWIAEPLDPGTRKVLREGYRVAFDRDGELAARLDSLELEEA